MSKAIPSGLTKQHILLAIQDLDNGIEHSFGLPTGYELIHEGKRYPPKAVVGVAFRHLTGSILAPNEFSGGEGPGQANHVLRSLGFTVEAIQPQDNLCVYTTLHGPQLEYAANLCQTGESDGPFCFRSNKKWKSAADYLESHTSMPLLIRNIEEHAPTLTITFSADLVEVWFDDDFENRTAHRDWLEEVLWVQREFYEEEGRTESQFQKWEVTFALKARTNFLVKNLRRVKPVPISRLRKTDGTALSPDFKYSYAVCRMPKSGSALFKKLTTAITRAEDSISEKELQALDKIYAGTPEYVSKVVNRIRRPSAVRTAILKRDGTTCRLCGCDGFEKKNGELYAETHHMIELNKKAPNTLQSWNVIVVCPTCHKKLHFGNVTTRFLDPGWEIEVNGENYVVT